MAMSQTILENELKALSLYTTEADAVTAWAEAFATFFEGDGATQGAMSNLVYVAAGAIAAAKAAMAAALSGMGVPGAGAAKIVIGIIAFWGALVPATAWPTVTLITPPTLLAGLDTTLQTTFNTNRDTPKTKDAAMDAIASDIYTANQGGLATWPALGAVAIT